MVVKTDTCFYTELRIYPGHGRRLIRRDGKLLAFIDQKSRSLYSQKIKAQRLTWTQAWRRKNKKGKVETAAKKRGKRTARVFKSIQGISMEDIKKRREAKPDLRKAQRQEALREVKERAKKAKLEKKKESKGKKAPQPSGGFEKVPKSRRLAKPAATSR